MAGFFLAFLYFSLLCCWLPVPSLKIGHQFRAQQRRHFLQWAAAQVDFYFQQTLVAREDRLEEYTRRNGVKMAVEGFLQFVKLPVPMVPRSGWPLRKGQQAKAQLLLRNTAGEKELVGTACYFYNEHIG